MWGDLAASTAGALLTLPGWSNPQGKDHFGAGALDGGRDFNRLQIAPRISTVCEYFTLTVSSLP